MTRQSVLEPLCTFPFNQHERFSIKAVQVEKKSLFVRIKNAIGYQDLYTRVNKQFFNNKCFPLSFNFLANHFYTFLFFQRLLVKAALLYEKTVDSIDYALFFKGKKHFSNFHKITKIIYYFLNLFQNLNCQTRLFLGL